MTTLRFNLHEGLASYQLGKAIRIVPALRAIIEDYRNAGLNDREIVRCIAQVINMIELEHETEETTKQ